MTKKTYASTDYDGWPGVVPGKVYEVVGKGPGYFKIFPDGKDLSCIATWLAGKGETEKNWTRHELTPSEAEAHNDNIKRQSIEKAINAPAFASDRSKALDELAELDSAEIAAALAEARIAEDAPKTWGEMTDAEKGALLLAHHDGKVIEFLEKVSKEWKALEDPSFFPPHAYRIKPSEPVIEERLEWWGTPDAVDLTGIITTYRDDVLTRVRLATDKETRNLEVEGE